MNSHSIIRPVSAGDAEKLGAFFEAIDRDEETRPFFHPHPLSKDYAVELCNRIERIKDAYFIALQSHGISAYSMLRGWDEGYQIPSFGCCVHPQLRNAGLGKQLLAHAIDESRSRGAEKLRLTVFKKNERAIAVYRRFGFEFTDKNNEEYIGVLKL